MNCSASALKPYAKAARAIPLRISPYINFERVFYTGVPEATPEEGERDDEYIWILIYDTFDTFSWIICTDTLRMKRLSMPKSSTYFHPTGLLLQPALRTLLHSRV